ncbi:hypothetical protein STPL106120_07620 [Streptococcus pluranimalium]
MTIFTKTINTIINLIFHILLMVLLILGTSILLSIIQSFNIHYLQFVYQIIKLIQIILFYLLTIQIIIISILIIANIVNRIIYDNLLNYWKSFYYTFCLRKFIKLEEGHNHYKDDTDSSSIYQKFNKHIKNCFIDLQENECLIIIKNPHHVQVLELLEPKLPKIKDHFSSQLVNYKFTSFERIGNLYICRGIRV